MSQSHKNRPNQYANFILKASAGLIAGVSTVFKFGRNSDIDTGSTPEDVIPQGGDKLFPTTSSTLSIVSTSTQDGVGGTGIQTMVVEGLDSDFNQQSETIIMNGTTPVITTLSYFRSSRMYGTLSGSNQRAVGDIIATHSEGLLVQIETGGGQTLDCTYTVPANHVLLLERLLASLERTSSGAGAEVHFDICINGGNTWRSQATLSIAAAGSSFVERSTDMFFMIPAKTDIKMRVNQVATNNTVIAGSFEGFLIDLGLFQW